MILYIAYYRRALAAVAAADDDVIVAVLSLVGCRFHW